MKTNLSIKQGGFTLFELMIVLGIAMVMAVYKLQEMKYEAEENLAQYSANHIEVIGKAVESYINDNTSTLEANANTSLTLTDLITSGDLAATTQTTNPWGSGYTIRVNRIGASAPYSYEALVATSTPYMDGGDTRLDVIGRAVEILQGKGGMTYDAATMTGLKGLWTQTNASFPGITVAGQLGYYISPSTAANYDSTYLRLDGTNSMQGALNMGSNNIVAAGDIASTGLTASGTVSSASVSTGAVTATGNVSSGSISSSGAISSGSTITATSSISGGSLNSTGVLTVSGNATVNGNVTANRATIADDIILSSLTAYGHSNNSLRDHASRYIIISTLNVRHGSVVDKPTCPTGGTPQPYIMMKSATRPNGADPNTFQGTTTSASDNGTSWTINMFDIFGNPLTEYNNAAQYQYALLWVACTF